MFNIKKNMKGKLYKDNDIHYYLIVDDKIIADSDSYPLSSITNKLSLKNCRAIERGYDLDELVSEADTTHLSRWTSDSHELMFDEGFKAGFQKALELLSDNKFSEEDMKSFARNYYREIRENTSNLLWDDLADKCMKEHIQSLQQTEWDVEIETVPALSNNGNVYYGEIPKLDENGCLILKKI
jgi:hypothetical protein